MSDLLFVVDIELTNRCNAKCYFCPRDATPHQGLMSREVFEQSVERAVGVQALGKVRVNLCGLGEPLLNKLAPEAVRHIRERGLECGLSSNGALLDEERGRALLDAGLQRIFINVGDVDEDYEEIYKLPFEKTRDNVVRFNEMAGDECEVNIVLVNHRQDQEHLQAMRAYWQEVGIDRFMEFEIMNRGGALFVDHMQYENYPQLPVARDLLDQQGGAICGIPFNSVFIGYDGQFYLCCSDWRKEVPLGSVFDETFFSTMEAKLRATISREPVCKTCNLDPLNRLTDMLRDIETGDAEPDERDELLGWIVQHSSSLESGLDKLHPGMVDRTRQALAAESSGKRLIPVTSL